MTTMLDWTSELNLLLERLVDGDLTDEQRSLLNQLLSRGDEQRCYYRTYMKLHAALEWRLGKQQRVKEVGYRTKTASDEQSQPLPLVQSPSLPPLPLHRPPRRPRLFARGHAAGVPGRDRGDRARYLGRLARLYVPS